ncbi:hypothetical protein DUZ99_06035 [Xylanibacillus composti]|uniref:Glyoxalase-like domain-containing protein n=1 Tax=Xylanibacillus composti TaxID=1572762 RepID=A0A8J4H651_9BACL|nr:VOC family protein [Xylanibacillus composti]MDT9724550.1 hypothetical protein [Xylanibacillus composti]GIQ70291.1 hypothetical protein XYCOK13_31150 [Xylanibacillus composti]
MLKCSHILCRVNNIAEVVRDLEAEGFSVEWGSAPERSLNALLWFEEGPFIEFFQIPKPLTVLIPPLGLVYGRVAGKRWAYWSRSPQGWCDVALEPDEREGAGAKRIQDLKAVKSAVNRAGISTSRLIHGRRTRPDGLKVNYSLFATEPLGLPFVVSAYDPPQRPDRIEHPNGASRVEWVKMGVAEEHLPSFQTLVNGDRWLKVVPSPQTGVLEVCLSGLTHTPDPGRLHGAVFATAAPGAEAGQPQWPIYEGTGGID